MPLELERVLYRDDLVALGVEQENRSRQLVEDRVQVAVRCQQRIDLSGVRVEAVLAGAERAAQPVGARRADRNDRVGVGLPGRHESEVAAHARTSERDRLAGALAEQTGDCVHIVESASIHRPVALPVAALVERDRREPEREQRPAEVVVALLARAGAVEDNDATAERRAIGQPQRVRETVPARDLRRQHGGDRPQAPHGATPYLSASVPTTSGQLSLVYPHGSTINGAGRLEIGGCDTVELAREFGTPVYVVAEDDLRARARAFVDGLAARHADSDVL